MNPAVTLGVALSGNIGVLLAMLYIMAQVSGAIAGAALLLVSW